MQSDLNESHPVHETDRHASIDRSKRRAGAARMAVLAVMSQCFFSGTNFLSAVIVGRFAGARELGLYSLCISAVMIAIAMKRSLLITPYVVLRSGQDKAERSRYRSAMFAAITLSSIVFLCVGVAGYVASAPPLFIAIAVAIPAGFSRDFVRRLALADLRPQQALPIDASIAGMQIAGLLGLALAFGDDFNAMTAIVWMCLTWTVVGLFALIRHRDQFALETRGMVQRIGRLWPVGRWIGISQVASTTQSFMLPWILASVHSLELAGIYAACWTIVQLASPVVEGLGSLVSPAYSSSVHRRDWKELKDRIRKTVLAYAGLMTLLCVVCFVGGNFLLALLYGPEYAERADVLAILALCSAVHTLGSPASKSITQLGYAKFNAVVAVIGFLINLLASLSCLLWFGPTGAAFGLLMGITVVFVAKWSFHARVFREHRQNDGEETKSSSFDLPEPTREPLRSMSGKPEATG